MGNILYSSIPPIQATRLAIILDSDDIKEDDYLSQSVKVLDEIKNASIGRNPTKGTSNDAVPFDQLHLLLQPSKLSLHDGYARLSDGTMYICVTIDFGKVTGAMIDWWFCNVDNTEKYHWWHPDDHISGTWDLDYISTPAPQRKPGHYIGHTHIVKEKIGGNPMNVNINFFRPSRYFDSKQLSDAGITSCTCARVYIDDPPFGYLAVGYVFHVLYKKEDDNSELKCYFWLGHIHKEIEGFNYVLANIINMIGNTSVFRRIRASESIAKGLYHHCYEEMSCLKNFLPHYYHHSMKKSMATEKGKEEGEEEEDDDDDDDNDFQHQVANVPLSVEDKVVDEKKKKKKNDVSPISTNNDQSSIDHDNVLEQIKMDRDEDMVELSNDSFHKSEDVQVASPINSKLTRTKLQI